VRTCDRLFSATPEANSSTPNRSFRLLGRKTVTTLPRLLPPAAFIRAACRITAALALALSGCRSLPLQPPIDLSSPGWIVREGQAVWQARAGAAGIAGELLVATHPDGRSVVQFTKTPLPFIVAQRTTEGWQAQIIPRNKTYSGRGAPPARLLWLHLPEALARGNAVDGFRFTTNAAGGWRLERLATGECLEGYFEPLPRSRTHLLKSGDHLAGLARMYAVTVKAIYDANPGEWRTWFRVGTRIQLPPPSPTP